jgi:penicillin-binding protein 1C
VFGPYVLIVWVGNFDGSGNPAFVGVDTAAPLFFQILDGIEAEHTGLAAPARKLPVGVRPVEICLASGDLPNQWCPQKGHTWFIPGKSPIRVSSVHRPVIVDDNTGRPACPPYAGKSVHQELYEFWPSDLLQVFTKAGIPRRKPPQNPDCANAGAPEGTPPQITSPLRGSSYVMRVTQQERQRIALAAVTDADVRTLYWFVDDGFVGSSKPGEAFFWQPASAGSYRLRAVDDHGRSDERPLDVRLIE